MIYTQLPLVKMENVVSFAKIQVHLNFGYLENEECILSEFLNISLAAIFQLMDARLV